MPLRSGLFGQETYWGRPLRERGTGKQNKRGEKKAKQGCHLRGRWRTQWNLIERTSMKSCRCSRLCWKFLFLLTSWNSCSSDSKVCVPTTLPPLHGVVVQNKTLSWFKSQLYYLLVMKSRASYPAPLCLFPDLGRITAPAS